MKILKSAISSFENFDVAVAEHAERLRQWRDHMARVEADKKNDKLPPIERHHPYARPRATEIVESAIDDNFNVSYEIEDDGAAMLARAKEILIARVCEAERVALHAVLPIGKRRLYDLREVEICQKDTRVEFELMEQRRKRGLLSKLLAREQEQPIREAVAQKRAPADTEHLQAQDERRRRYNAIAAIAAQAMHDIEDLTVETIGSWQDPDFSGV